MAQRIAISGASKFLMHSIIANTAEGDFVLKRRFGKDDPKLVTTLRKIEAAGSIDPTLWKKRDYQKAKRRKH